MTTPSVTKIVGFQSDIETPSPQYGTHLPALIKAVTKTSGPILECGCGIFSTPFLHFACYENRRKLATYESNEDFFNWLKPFANDYHEIHLVKDWETVIFNSHWSVVLIDHDPTWRRKEEIKKIAFLADFVVVHDTNPRLDGKYRYSEIYPLFKFRKDYNSEKPHTAVLSNFQDLSHF